MRGTSRQLEVFEEQGYLVLPARFEPDDIAVISAAFDELRDIAARFHQLTRHDDSLFVINGTPITRVVWCSGAGAASVAR